MCKRNERRYGDVVKDNEVHVRCRRLSGLRLEVRRFEVVLLKDGRRIDRDQLVTLEEFREVAKVILLLLALYKPICKHMPLTQPSWQQCQRSLVQKDLAVNPDSTNSTLVESTDEHVYITMAPLSMRRGIK